MSSVSGAALKPVHIKAVLAKVVQECQNGLLGRVLAVPVAAEEAATLLDDAVAYADSIDATYVRRTSGVDIRVPLAAITVELTDGTAVVTGHHLELARRAGRPAPRAGSAGGPDEDDAIRASATWMTEVLRTRDGQAIDRLEHLLKNESWLLASLASDVLNRVASRPAIPQFVRDHDPHHATTGAGGRDGSFTEVWEDRIDVDEYALFEATHPAYAQQMVELARMIERHGPAGGRPGRILDIGSGPGLPTVMLSELFPGVPIDAVEPSAAAFPHLTANVAGHPITPHHCGITEFPGTEAYPVVVSVGASHHLDTRMFFRAMRRLVQPDGLIVVADELISEFTCEEERTRIITDHHMAYIDEALAHVEPTELPEVERRRFEAFRTWERYQPGALHRLLETVRQDRRAHVGIDGAWQRVRFAVLELEALVAGIDYDVERKTYPRNFMNMARQEGLEVLEHRRVYGTIGSSTYDAGTHVVALCRMY